jgi:low temperature requirement protein LtrA
MYLNEKGLKKGSAEFMIYVFGGMVARIFINLTIILFLSQILKVTFNSFILVFFVFYVIFLIIELIYLAKYEKRPKLTKQND